MKILLLGSGGREHALAWKISQSPLVDELHLAPGNPGTATLGKHVAIASADPTAVADYCVSERIDLLVIGPEAPLIAGVADEARRRGVAVFGPDRAAAAVEGSKAFAKVLMAEARIPTAACRVFDDPETAETAARVSGRIVVKVDGLAGGKGVIVADDGEQAAAAVRALRNLGGAPQRLLLEERLEGPEASVIGLCDGTRYALFPAARDHKRLLVGDRGPNTGGMGAICPAPGVDDALLASIGETVFAPLLAALSRRGTPFVGALFAGLMLTPEGPRVLEFNCRFGDPETQVLMLKLKSDLVPLLLTCAKGSLDKRALSLHEGTAVGVVLAARGYPDAPELGGEIRGLSNVANAHVFHAGTRFDGAALRVSGGRVLTVASLGADAALARAEAYRAAARIEFPGKQFREDIGASA